MLASYLSNYNKKYEFRATLNINITMKHALPPRDQIPPDSASPQPSSVFLLYKWDKYSLVLPTASNNSYETHVSPNREAQRSYCQH